MTPNPRSGGAPHSRRILLVALLASILVAGSLGAYRFLGHAPTSTARAELSSFTSASQTSRYVTEYTVGPSSLPNAIATDSKGDVWFTLAANYSVAELVPSNGTVREFAVPGQNGTLVSWGIAVDSSGDVWLTDQSCNCIRSLNPSTGTFTDYAIPTPQSDPYQLAVDSSGDVWFTELGAGKLGEITPAGAMVERQIPPLGQLTPSEIGPAGIVTSGGTVWFDEVYAGRIASFSDGEFRQYSLGNFTSPTGIAIDQEGDLWTTLHGGSDILELDPQTNATFALSTSVIGVQETLPYFIHVDARGDVWFNEHFGNAIARFDPANSTLVEYEIPTQVQDFGNISGALTMALSPSGRPWFTESYSGKVGTVDTNAPVQTTLRIENVSADGALTVSGGVSSAVVAVTGFNETRLAASSSAGPGFAASFSPAEGIGSFSSTMVLSGIPPEALSVTVSAISPGVVFSVVVRLDDPS